MINAPSAEQLASIPSLYETENIPFEEKLVYQYFTIQNCHWWAMEFDGKDTFFGYVMLNGWLQDSELGYFFLSELSEVKLGGVLEVECDPNWIIRPAKDIGLIREILDFKSTINKRIANY